MTAIRFNVSRCCCKPRPLSIDLPGFLVVDREGSPCSNRPSTNPYPDITVSNKYDTWNAGTGGIIGTSTAGIQTSLVSDWDLYSVAVFVYFKGASKFSSITSAKLNLVNSIYPLLAGGVGYSYPLPPDPYAVLKVNTVNFPNAQSWPNVPSASLPLDPCSTLSNGSGPFVPVNSISNSTVTWNRAWGPIDPSTQGTAMPEVVPGVYQTSTLDVTAMCQEAIVNWSSQGDDFDGIMFRILSTRNGMTNIPSWNGFPVAVRYFPYDIEMVQYFGSQRTTLEIEGT